MASVIAQSSTAGIHTSSYGSSVNALRPSASTNSGLVTHNPASTHAGYAVNTGGYTGANANGYNTGAGNGVYGGGGGSSSSIRHSSSNSNSLLAASIVNRPSLIEYKNLRFLIMDAPTESNVHAYIEVLKKKNVVAVVRACEPTYQVDALIRSGIKVMEAPFPDGDPPGEAILNDWLALVNRVFSENQNLGNKTPHARNVGATTTSGTVMTSADRDDSDARDKKTIAVHCVAGLGRAPVMVAIALIEAGMSNLDVIDFIRKRRRGAFNSKQLKYIQSYKPRNTGKKGECTIM